MMTILAGVFVILLVAAAALYVLWPHLVFAPVHYDKRDAFHAHPERFRPLQLLREQNVILEGIAFEPDAPVCTVLYFGGKEQDSVALVGKLSERFPRWRILAFNYRGYGLSEGRPDEQALLEDAVHVAKYAKERYGDLVIMGYSLGASIAAFAASRTDVELLLLVAPFYDIHAIAKKRVPLLPEWLVRCKFETARYLGGVQAPVGIFSSRDDTLVPIKQSRALRERVHRLAVYKEYSGYNHEDILGSDAFAADVTEVCR